MPHAYSQRAFGDLQLNGVVVEIQKRKTSVAAETNRRGAEVQLGARVVVSPKFVSRSHGPIHDRGHPFVRARRLKRDRAIDVTEASYARGRIILVSSSALRNKNYHRHRKSDQACKLERVFSHNQILS